MSNHKHDHKQARAQSRTQLHNYRVRIRATIEELDGFTFTGEFDYKVRSQSPERAKAAARKYLHAKIGDEFAAVKAITSIHAISDEHVA